MASKVQVPPGGLLAAAGRSGGDNGLDAFKLRGFEQNARAKVVPRVFPRGLRSQKDGSMHIMADSR
jgi:hypothetical protein